jgi:hypothetical protein
MVSKEEEHLLTGLDKYFKPVDSNANAKSVLLLFALQSLRQ